MPVKLGKTSQHHTWPRYTDWPQIGPKIAIKQGEKRQKDKWYLFRTPTPPFTRETGAIWQIGILTAERSIFLPQKSDFRRFCAAFSVKKFGPLLRDSWSTGTFGSVRYVLRLQRHFVVKKTLHSAVRAPICQIVPVSRSYPPQKKPNSFRGGNTYLF